jgi:hypothetical protein
MKKPFLTSSSSCARSSMLRGENWRPAGVLVPDRQVFLTAIPAEMDRVELAAPVAGNVLAAVERQETLAGCLQRGEHLATTGDELVQLEGKQAASAILGGLSVVW